CPRAGGHGSPWGVRSPFEIVAISASREPAGRRPRGPPPTVSVAFRSVVLEHGLVAHHLQQLHHAAVLVPQDVAVLHVLAGEIDEAAAHLEVARADIDDSYSVPGDDLGDRGVALVVRDYLARRNRERIPPDVG